MKKLWLVVGMVFLLPLSYLGNLSWKQYTANVRGLNAAHIAAKEAREVLIKSAPVEYLKYYNTHSQQRQAEAACFRSASLYVFIWAIMAIIISSLIMHYIVRPMRLRAKNAPRLHIPV